MAPSGTGLLLTVRRYATFVAGKAAYCLQICLLKSRNINGGDEHGHLAISKKLYHSIRLGLSGLVPEIKIRVKLFFLRLPVCRAL